MAKFKLFLLTPQTKDGGTIYLKTPISEFYSQQTKNIVNELKNLPEQKNSYCYSFDEKLSLHTNAQKELTFSMVRNIWLGDSLTTNPFVINVHAGSQLLLVDKYENEFIFTVKNINYKITKDNIVYDYSCQDSFSYQTTRLNDGYTIDNSPDSEDFIGAKTVDWWVVNKIKPECHLEYIYVPLFNGLYLSKEDEHGHRKIKEYTNSEQLNDVFKQLKQPYSKEKYPEYYESIPFSVSGTTCSAALISLAEELGFMINTAEKLLKSGDMLRYFWFEPIKKEEVSDIKYSPFVSIQSFSLSHDANELTTVLNVEGNNISDELVTLIPSVPFFFRKYIESNEWKDTVFSPGMFTSVCQRKISKITNAIDEGTELRHVLQIGSENYIEGNYLYIKIWNRKYDTDGDGEYDKFPFYLSPWYDKITFKFEDSYSYVYINEQRFAATLSNWSFVERIVLGNNEYNYIEYNDSFNTIPEEKLGTEIDAYIRIAIGDEYKDAQSIENSFILLNFYRDCLEEELEFAEIADQCPWLENKLIDISYFYQQNIISKSEYNSFLDIINNELRINNGLLLIQTNAYYQALHEKTKTLADLTNSLDSLGASFAADVVDYYMRNGAVPEYKKFKNNYMVLMDTYLKSGEPKKILGYSNLLTDSFNKYFNSQQRFLKNIYLFKKYFNSPSLFNGELYRHVVTIDKDKDKSKNYFFSFKNYNLNSIGSSFESFNKRTLEPFVDIYESDGITRVEVVHKENCTNYYTPKIIAGSMIPVKETGYIVGKTYYRVLYKISKNSLKKPPEKLTHDDSKEIFVRHHMDDSWVYYGFLDTDEEIQKYSWFNNGDIKLQFNKDGKSFTYNATPSYEQVSIQEVVSEFLYRKIRNKKEDVKYVYHDKDTTKDLVLLRSDEKEKDTSKKTIYQNLGKYLSLSAWRILLSPEDESNSEWDPLYINDEVKEDDNIQSTELGQKLFKKLISKLYIKNFPLTSVLLKKNRYVEKPFSCTVNNRTYSTTYQMANKNGQTISEYINYWKRKNIDKENIDEILNPTEYIETYNIPIITTENESNYYRRVVRNPGWGHFWGGFLGVGAGLGAGLLAPTGVMGVAAGAFLGSVVYNIVSDAVWKNAKTTWDTSGKNTQNCEGKKYNKIYEGYVDIREKPSSFNLNYTTSADSYDSYVRLKLIAENNSFIKLIKEVNETKNTSNNQPLTESGESEEYYYPATNSANGKKLVYVSSGAQLNEYYNYYKLFGFTYSDIEEEQVFKYKETYLRPVKRGEFINPKFNYKMLIQETENSKGLIFNKKDDFSNFLNLNPFITKDDLYSEKFSKIIHYPIANNLTNISWSVIPNFDKSVTIEEALAAAGFNCSEQSGKDYWWQWDKKVFMVIQEEDFNRKFVNNLGNFDDNGKLEAHTKRFNLYDGRPVYLNEEEVNFLKEKDLLVGFYEVADKNTNFEKIENDTELIWEETSEDGVTHYPTSFYKKNSNSFERVYSIIQIKNLNKYYYLGSLTKTFEDLNREPFNLDTKLYLHLITEEKEEVIELPELQILTGIKKEDDKKGNRTYKQIVKYNGVDYELKTKIKTTSIQNISSLSNGNFWYTYREKTDFPLLQEQAAIIERELTMYWTQAYNASKYCEYFLPESWTPELYGVRNHFISDIFHVTGNVEGDEEDPITNIHLELSSLYIPEVNVYSEGVETRLPIYNICYKQNKQDIAEDSKKIIINSNQMKSMNLYKNNKVFKNVLSVLDDDGNNLYIEAPVSSDYNKKTYYYSEYGGTKWKNILNILKPSAPIFDYFDGLYVMQYKILKKAFIEELFNSYEKLQEEHQSIWNRLYTNYSGMILESTYQNEKASTSRQLFKLSQNFLKDKTKPEQGYNISLIDTASLKGYGGQELRIGESISLDADEYYTDIDLIKKSISQYLFITDISYDLRKDNDISLTVNYIKYQDKLIQRLVKLIK